MTRIVSLADDAYDMLKRLKRPGESFSGVTRRLVLQQQKGSILDFVGVWKDVDVEKMKRDLRRERKRAVRAPVRV